MSDRATARFPTRCGETGDDVEPCIGKAHVASPP
jgi:hypothetical protein